MYLINLYNFLFGYVVLRISGGKPEKFINFLIYNKIRFWNLRKYENGIFYINISSRLINMPYFEANAEKMGLTADIFEKKGFRFFLERHKKRLGLYTGALFGIVIMYISTLYVWDVKIEYSDFTDNSQIIGLLKELGVKAGARISELDIDSVQNEVLLRDNNIKWIALNLSGTVIHTEIRKREPAPEIIDLDSPQNIIAKTAGRITVVETFEGQAVVKEEMTVKKGELLISGLVDSSALGVRVKRAAGRVIAETEKVIEVMIPYKTEKKYYTGAEKIKRSASVLGRSLNLYINGNPGYERYDKTEERENLKILGFIELPVIVESRIFRETGRKNIILEQNEAKNIALLKIDDIIDSELGDLEIISKEYTQESDRDFFYLKCRLTCLEDIAEAQPFETNIKTEK